jgi:hypothetical protein
MTRPPVRGINVNRTMRNLGLAFLTVISYGVLSQGASTGSLDFRNFSYPWPEGDDEDVPTKWHWLEVLPDNKIRLHNGLHRFIESKAGTSWESSPYLKYVSATFGKLDESPDRTAAVILNYSTGGTANWNYLYVFRLRGDKAKALALLESGSRADGGLLKAEFHDGLLVLDFADADRRIGDCCSNGYIRVRYHLRDDAFVQIGAAEHGDLAASTPMERHPRILSAPK